MGNKSKSSRTYAVVTSRSLEAGCRVDTCSREFEPHEIELRPSEYSMIFGRRFGVDQRHAPWSKGIVKVSAAGAPPIYLRFRGTNRLTASQAGLDLWTAARIGFLDGRTQLDESFEIQCSDAGRWVGPLWVYWQHPDDAARVSFKVGVLGIGFALIAFIMDWTRWCLTLHCA